MSLQKRDNHLIRPTTDKRERQGKKKQFPKWFRLSSAGTELSTKTKAGKEIYNQDTDSIREEKFTTDLLVVCHKLVFAGSSGYVVAGLGELLRMKVLCSLVTMFKRGGASCAPRLWLDSSLSKHICSIGVLLFTFHLNLVLMSLMSNGKCKSDYIFTKRRNMFNYFSGFFRTS